MNSQPASPSLSITSLALGIIALLCGFLAILSIPLGIAAILTGIFGIKKGAGKGMAIAGIITGSIGLLVGLVGSLLILLALPAMQQSQQDTQLKNDISVAYSAINSYQANNQGALPSAEEFSSEQFKEDYLLDDLGSVEYKPGVDCAGKSSLRSYTVSATLSNDEIYCID